MNFKNIIFIAVVVVLILQLITSQANKEKQGSKKQSVALSTFSLYDITRNISADTLELVMILPFGVDAHSFEPTPKLMVSIHNSDLVIYSGAGLEPWIDGFDFKSKTIDMSKFVQLREVGEHIHNHSGTCNHGSVDPHYWLDIQNMIKATNIITQELIAVSPVNRELYLKNRDSYLSMLKNLDTKYAKTLTSCKKDTIIVNHNAFSYLSESYGFHVEALSGLSPEAEPSAKNMMRLIEYVREHNISTIFFESFVSDRAMKSIANEANVKVDVLQPLGNITADEAAQNLSFEDIMEKNLQKLSKALECR